MNEKILESKLDFPTQNTTRNQNDRVGMTKTLPAGSKDGSFIVET